MTIRFQSLLWCCIGLFVALVGAAQAQEKLVLGYSNLQSSKIPIPIAKDAGLFAKHGLEVEMIRVTPGNTAVPKLLSGEIQIFLGNGAPIVKAAMTDRAPLVVIASLGESSFQLVARSTIHTIEELKGKRVGPPDCAARMVSPESALGHPQAAESNQLPIFSRRRALPPRMAAFWSSVSYYSRIWGSRCVMIFPSG